ncbi:hypothetical protein GGH94_005881 [Coemansia aciculifera]|uniref:Actin-like ATPase domain-containing protein n=1 Tax=Coemansia aciculifera TaxID=417176 RepID=A0A9W8ICQ8_9FUNG|nr:hypothetical protein GGH94_005881 [Coemansia aciculifera]
MTSTLDSLNFLRRPLPSSSSVLSGIGVGSSSTASSILYGASTEEKIVIDIGTHSLRAGFSGDYAPIHSSALNTKFTFSGGTITRTVGHTSHNTPVETEEELEMRLVEHLRDVYRRDLLVDARTRKVALVESALAPVGLRLAVARVLLGNLRVPQLSFYPGSVAALMTCGSVRAGLVIDCGHRTVSVTPVYEARALPPYATSTPLAGSALFDNLRGLLQNYARFTPASGDGKDMECLSDLLSDSVVTHVMTKMLLASPIAPPEKMRASLGVVGRNDCVLSDELVSFYESSSTCTGAVTKLTIDTEWYGRGLLVFPSWIRERAAEPLFCGDPAADHQSIPDAIVQCVGRVPVDTRRALIANVLVIGGVADLPGFRHRLLHDIVARLRRDSRWAALAADAALADDSQAFAPSDRSWTGASLAVAAKIGTVEISRDDFDGCTLPDWTTITQ